MCTDGRSLSLSTSHSRFPFVKRQAPVAVTVSDHNESVRHGLAGHGESIRHGLTGHGESVRHGVSPLRSVVTAGRHAV